MDVMILFTEWKLSEMTEEQVRQVLAYELSWAMDDIVEEGYDVAQLDADEEQ